MHPDCSSLNGQVALITGAARRIGADVARYLHAAGMDIVLHFHSSVRDAKALYAELSAIRADSVLLLQADLRDTNNILPMINSIHAWHQRLDLLVNNASTFYPTPVADATEVQWDDLMGANLKAPFFLARFAAPLLRASGGVIINMVDIHAERPLKNYAIYSIAKAGNAMMVKALARELAPQIRVNGIAPGVILWSEAEASDNTQQAMLKRIPLQRPGDTTDIAKAVLFLYRDASYVTGQIIAIDGGRTTQQ